MFKKILTAEENKYFKVTVIPFIIYCVLIAIIIIIGNYANTLSSDTINGYVHGMILCGLINYVNLSIIELKETKHNKGDEYE